MRIELSDVNQEEDVENDYLLKKVIKAALNCAAFLFQIVLFVNILESIALFKSD
jgi:hypothetical protein